MKSAENRGAVFLPAAAATKGYSKREYPRKPIDNGIGFQLLSIIIHSDQKWI